MHIWYPYIAAYQIRDRHNPVRVNYEIYILLIQRVKITHCINIRVRTYILMCAYINILLIMYLHVYVDVCCQY